MKKATKQEIRLSAQTALENLFTSHGIKSPSKGTKKSLSKLSKAIAGDLKYELKKQFKKSQKISKKDKHKSAMQPIETAAA